MKIIYDKKLPSDVSSEFLEKYYTNFILPLFNLKGTLKWKRHIQTGPDSFMHTFLIGDIQHVLVFEDYPSGFELNGEKYVHVLHCKNGDELLLVDNPDGKYVENVTGAFMLFQVLDDEEFDVQTNYLELSFKHLRDEWENESKHLVAVTRDILQLAETAAANKDWKSLYSISNLIKAFDTLDAFNNDISFSELKTYVDTLDDTELRYSFDEKNRKHARDAVYSRLSREAQYQITSSKYTAQNLGTTVTLVTATYAQKTADVTSGVSVVIVIDNGFFTYPMNHFLDPELQDYFRNNPDIDKIYSALSMPYRLSEYTLVEGSVDIQQLFRRELEHISW